MDTHSKQSYHWKWGDPYAVSISLDFDGTHVDWRMDDYGGRDRNDDWGRTETYRQSFDQFLHEGVWSTAIREAALPELRAGIAGLFAAIGQPAPGWLGNLEMIDAARRNETGRILPLLSGGVDPNFAFGDIDALGEACRVSAIDAALMLLDAGVTTNRLYKGHLGKRYTALLWTIESARWYPRALELADALIRHGANVELRGEKGETPLICAAKHDPAPFAIVARLLEAKADPNAFCDANQLFVFDYLMAGWPPLYAVLMREETRIGDCRTLIAMLVKAGASPDVMPSALRAEYDTRVRRFIGA